ncbi:MAG: adenylate/guanylate cyclase domain-containing protein [Bacteroidales bacterium]|nr:adenylate/guanylate cyclase domain-containing protein [Bacteroidales bacterium]MDY0084370.1 adenylate/guanylate cyclase domain-containing protein [Bacteroidales bacterium]
MNTKKKPAFFALRIYLVSLLLFLLLVFPVSLIMLFKYGPYWIEERGVPSNDIKNNTEEIITTDSLSANNVNTKKWEIKASEQDKRFGKSVSLLFRMMLFSLLLGFAFNTPFQRFFKLKRKNKPPSEALLNFCRKWLLYVPIINSGILALGFIIALIIMGFQVFDNTIDSEASKQFYRQFFFIATFAAFLSVFFMYFWFRFRVRFKYLEIVYDSVSLYKSPINKPKNHLIHRLWVNSLMTTLLPLVIVIFYISFSISNIHTSFDHSPSSDQAKVLFGKYLPIIDQTEMLYNSNLFYVNAIDSILMFVGIFSGILISIIYLFFFVSWTNKSIIIPVSEIIKKMQQTGEQELGQLTIVRTTDEFGELAMGYNEMASRITNNIKQLQQNTTANQRFVPVQFLHLLGKQSITEVKVGDQIQKIMTVLFVDIKSFTSLSEQLSPKENFDFLNAYLQHMEPIIHKHHGFIDKFIGDSIMALFEECPEHAIDAAREMQNCLKTFNLQLIDQGKQPIETGTGIHTGSLILGMVGGEGRMEGTVVSDAVNLASRLEGLTRIFGEKIIISETTYNYLENKNKYQITYLDEVTVKGRLKTVKIYAVEAHNNPHYAT